MKKTVLLLALLLLLCCGSAAAAAGDGSPELLSILTQVEPQPMLPGRTGPVQDGVEFQPIVVPRLLQAQSSIGDGTLPGEQSERVRSVKEALSNLSGTPFISHTQTREETADLFDVQLETLVETLYDFCGLEGTPCLDGLTVSLLEAIPQMPEAMRQDLYTVYKARLIAGGIDGSLLRSGGSLGFYYYAQTDPDWATYPFPNAGDPDEAGDTMQNRSCGVMSMAMVAATYLHRELEPTELADYAVDNGWRISDSGVDDTFFLEAADLYGLPEPEIFYQGAIDWDTVVRWVGEEHRLAIVHAYRGNFTSNQHYMVLMDVVERGGTRYFLLADPYQLRSRYSQWGTARMADAGLGDEGLILATPDLVAETCSAVTVFQGSILDWPVTCAASEAVWLPLGGTEHD